MSDDFSDISDAEVVSATQLIEELYTEDTDADLIVASQQFDEGLRTDCVPEELYGQDTDADLIAVSQQFDSVPDSAAAATSNTAAIERPFASPMPQSELEELNRSRFAKKTVDKSIWAVTIFGEWRAHRNRCCLEKSDADMLYLNKCVFYTFPCCIFYNVLVCVNSFDIYLELSIRYLVLVSRPVKQMH